jgi:hypothetical protein
MHRFAGKVTHCFVNRALPAVSTFDTKDDCLAALHRQQCTQCLDSPALLLISSTPIQCQHALGTATTKAFQLLQGFPSKGSQVAPKPPLQGSLRYRIAIDETEKAPMATM